MQTRNTPPITPAPVPVPVPANEAGLVNYTTAVLQFGPKETSRPILTEATSKSWKTFSPMWTAYHNDKGLSTLFDSMKLPAVLAYQVYLKIPDLKILSCSELFDKIDNHHFAHHKLKNTTVNIKEALRKWDMSDAVIDFDQHAIEQAVASFIVGVAEDPKLKANMTDKEHAEGLLSILRPTWVRTVITGDKKIITFEEAVVAITLSYPRLEDYTAIHAIRTAVPLPIVSEISNLNKRPWGGHRQLEGKVAAAAVTSPSLFCHNHNSNADHDTKSCPQREICLRCDSTRHAYWSKSCPLWIAKHGKKSAANATIPSDKLSALLKLADLADHVQVSSLSSSLPDRQDIFVDSGANAPFVHKLDYMDNPIALLPSLGSYLTTADSSPVPIEGHEQFLGYQADYVPKLSNTLLPVSTLTMSNKLVLFDDKSMFSVERTPLINKVYKLLQCLAFGLKLVNVTANLSNGLYSTSIQALRNLKTMASPVPPLYPITVDAITASNLAFCSSREILVTPAPAPDFQTWVSGVPLPGGERIAYDARYKTVHLRTLAEMVEFFHNAWNHASLEKMVQIVVNKLFDNIPSQLTAAVIRKHFQPCWACAHGNLSRAPLDSDPMTRVIDKGEEIELDIKHWTNPDGSIAYTFGKCRYSVTAYDLATGYLLPGIMKNRKQLDRHVRRLYNEIKQRGRTLKCIRVDDEFVTTRVRDFCSDQTPPIEIKPCIPYEHGQLGLIERSHRTIQDSVVKALDLQHKTHLSNAYWGFAYFDCIDKLNLLPAVSDSSTSAYIRWHDGKRIDLLKTPMMSFGTIVMAHEPLDLQTVLGGRSFETYYVGRAEGYKGGLTLFNPLTKRSIVRRTFKVLGPEYRSKAFPAIPLMYDTTDEDLSDVTLNPVEDPIPAVVHENTTPTPELPIAASDWLQVPSNKTHIGKYHVSSIDAHRGSPKQRTKMKFHVQWNGGHPSTWNSWNQVRKLDALRTYINSVPRLHQLLTLKDQLTEQKNDMIAMKALKSSYKIPLTYMTAAADIKEGPQYIQAKNCELASMSTRDVWCIPKIPISEIPSNLIYPSKLICDRLTHPDGTYKKHKVRLTIRGDLVRRTTETDNYAHTVRSTSIKMILAIAAEHDLELECIDVKTAFLYSPLAPDEVIYMRRPPGLTDADMPAVVQLKKSIYGLPQASARFRDHSDQTLRAIGFRPLKTDPCVYRLDQGQSFILASVHVDDIGLASNSKVFLHKVVSKIEQTYDITHDKDLQFYLGMHIIRDRPNKSIYLLQDGYIHDILDTYNIIVTDSTIFPTTPMCLSTSKHVSSSTLLDVRGIRIYKSKLGALLYLSTQTRPDIHYAVTTLTRQTKPTVSHDLAVDRIFLYLAGTMHLGIRLHSGEGIQLYATVDASYACHDDFKSHTGCTLHIGRQSGSFSTLSKKQTITADSSTVAEFIAAHTVAKEVMWARNFLEELGYAQTRPTTIFEDNQSTIALIMKDGNGNRTKHIAMRYYFIKELVKQDTVRIEYLPTEDMTSDILTKPTGPTLFTRLRSKLLGMLVIKMIKTLQS